MLLSKTSAVKKPSWLTWCLKTSTDDPGWSSGAFASQRQMVLESHMFLKEKGDGSLKARTVTGGNKQRGHFCKEDASSLTVTTWSVLLTCITDAEEGGRDVAVIATPNGFTQTGTEDEKDMAFIKIRGVLMGMLVDIAPDVHKARATKDKKGVAQSLVQCRNALCGRMVASLLCCRKFAKRFDGHRFRH